jgi:hypothetical protein
MTTVRDFSPAGPCITRGELVRETAAFYVYKPRFKQGTKRIAKSLPGRWSGAHIEACESCRDHARTQYPNGYMD